MTNSEAYSLTRVRLDTIKCALDALIFGMTIIRDNAPHGDPIRADFRKACEYLEVALTQINAADERLTK